MWRGPHLCRCLDYVQRELTGRSLQAKQLRLGEHPVTQDVLIGVQAGLEKQRWMFSAQQS